jgi:hypothetical protein
MTRAKIEADRILVNFLKSNLTDPNSSRSSEWIYPDFPRVKDLGDASFPRIGVTILTEASDPLGQYDDDQYETITFQIDIVAKKGQTYSVTTTDESMGTVSSTINSNRLTYNYVPNTITNIKHAGSAYSTLVERSTVANFTTPANVGSGTVEWAFSTGDLNFDSTDVSSHNGQAITSTYIRFLEGKKLCQWISREIIKNIKNNWRTDSTINGLLYPLKISNNPVPFDEDFGIFRQMIEYRFRAYNLGEGIGP